MSLEVGKFFIKALKTNSALVAAVGGRIFPVARSMEDDQLDQLPYIIMQPEVLTNEGQTKDDVEGITDRANVSLLVCASTYDELVQLTQSVRETIHAAYNDGVTDDTWHFDVDGYDFSADAVNYDAAKPCYWQTLRYLIYTINITQ